MPEPPRNSPKRVGRSDRYPSDYGRRDIEEDERKRAKVTTPIKKLLKTAIGDEQGNPADVRQNKPPKGLRSKR